MIRVGTAGWHYDDWNGVVYPDRRPRGFDPLQEMTRLFDTIEVNVTFYRTPHASMARSWEERAEWNDRFRFTVKLPRSFTHARGQQASDGAHGASADDDEARFREAIDPLREAGRLGAVLIQFPQSFHAAEPEAAYLEGILERFG